jgi:signal transduction histidine kinase
MTGDDEFPSREDPSACLRHAGRRLRDAIWRMEESSDATSLIGEIRTILTSMDVDFSDCNVQLVDDSTDPIRVRHIADSGAGKYWRTWAEDAPAAHRVIAFWRQGQPVYRQDLLADDPHGEAELLTPLGIRSVADIPFEHGTLAVSSLSPAAFSPEELSILGELAEALEEGFLRVADLRRMETRESELQIMTQALQQNLARESMLAAARLSISSMDRPGDLPEVIATISHQLQQQGVSHNICSVQIINRAGTDFINCGFDRCQGRIWGEGRIAALRNLDWGAGINERHVREPVLQTWRTRVPRVVTSATAADNLPEGHALIEVGFGFGTIALRRADEPFDKQDLELLSAMGTALTEGFTRFLDLMASTQAEEAHRAVDEKLRGLNYLEQFRSRCETARSFRQVQDVVGLLVVEVLLEHDPGVSVEITIDDEFQTYGSQSSGDHRYTYPLRWDQIDRGLFVITGHRELSPTQERIFLAESAGYLGRVLRARELEQQLSQASRLSSLGQMAAGVAHELNQPLTGIRVTIDECRMQLATDSVPSLEDIKRMTADIDQMLTRATGVVDMIRSLSREQPPTEATLFDVNDAVRTVVPLVQPECAAAGVEVVLDLATESLDCAGSRQRLEQVLINLLVNARDALKGADRATRPTVMLTTKCLDSGCQLSIHDNGPGIPVAIRDRIFDPFFTTKGPDQGMGLGLSLVQAHVRQLGGSIHCSTPSDGGTTFSLLLPSPPQG